MKPVDTFFFKEEKDLKSADLFLKEEIKFATCRHLFHQEGKEFAKSHFFMLDIVLSAVKDNYM